ncbi:hypothetical protein PR202_ga29747 [Eleusine coracana subsp. coracana]|uniref:PGG domain-containing protein n=1 Tax=Eleusine coracana subsp. coracana TaxID=191504 RepID=A0AAV5DKS9_ELECO|nr:hypothetical protein QOZ80_7AG0570120 [Eleusine coracana subsp. coracana]GJN11548.1 hypothetical protein PR202_ga29747 [Eleusine coracana subsp. coracana]
MAETPAAPVEFGPEKKTLSVELLQVLTAGNATRLEEILSSNSQTNGHVAINVQATAPPPPEPGTSSCLLGVTSNGNTALHLVASRGHAELAALICEKAPSLVATRNTGLDTPLHCAAGGGYRDVAACLLSTMLNAGVDEAVALRCTNRKGDTALHEAVRHGRAEMVDLFMAEAPDLASVVSDDGVSPLYMAATTESVQMVRLLLRPSPDGTPSPASSAGREGRTALHAAAAISKEMVQDIMAWEPEGPALLTKLDSSGRSPLHFAIGHWKLDVFKLLLDADTHLARIPDNNGLFPLHHAAIVRSTRMTDELIQKCPDYSEMVDHEGRNLLHCAVKSASNTIVQYICQNDRFTVLLNATDWEVSTGRSRYFLDPAVVVFHGLLWARATGSLDIIDMDEKDNKSAKEEEMMQQGGMRGTIASGLIAAVTFAAALTVPGGFVADDHPHSGTAILARRFVFRAFTVSDTMAFLCSVLATCFLMYGSAKEVPLSQRHMYNPPATGLVPLAVQFMIGAFAFGFHLVLGVANHGLMIFVYLVSSAAVLFCFPGIWGPFCLGYVKAIRRRAGWTGLLSLDDSKPCVLQLLRSFRNGPLNNVRRILFAVLICATFFVAVVLEIALPNF